MLDVYDHSVPHDVDHALAENPRRKKIEDKFPALVDDRMPRVVPALITAHDVEPLGKKVDHSALPFVAPIDAADRCKHFLISFLLFIGVL